MGPRFCLWADCRIRQLRAKAFGRSVIIMEQKPSYVRISDLLKAPQKAVGLELSKCDEALSLIAQAFQAIDSMTIAEREELMLRLRGWMLVEKFEVKGQSTLTGLQRYCVADCLNEDPTWSPRTVGLARDLFSAL